MSAATVACFAVAMVNHSFFAAMLAWLALSYLCTSLLFALLSLHGFTVKRAFLPNAAVGQLAKMPLVIDCRHPWLRQPVVVCEKLGFAEGGQHTCVFAPDKGNTGRIFERDVMAVKRGEYKLDALFLRGGDPAGIFMRERRFSLPATMLVYPKADKVESEVPLFKYEAFTDNSDRLSGAQGGYQEFRSLRKYVPSDPMKLINWRSTAKYQKLMVREYERNSIISIALFVEGFKDYVSPNGENLEAIISRAAGIFEMCSDIYCSFTFIVGGFTPASMVLRPVEECRARLMYELAVMRPGNAKLPDLIEEVAPSLPQGTLVFCLSLNKDNPLLQKSMDNLAARGMLFM
ncbi:MAG: DUF58 domain-containing protein [Victivallales bacterium]|nr:DUF58 domain-containing protein [Victivallales bacterium]